MHVSTVPTAPTSEITFIITHSPRPHIKGWAKGEKLLSGKLSKKMHYEEVGGLWEATLEGQYVTR